MGNPADKYKSPEIFFNSSDLEDGRTRPDILRQDILRIKTLARIKSLAVDGQTDAFTCDLYENGYDKDATKTDILVHALHPYDFFLQIKDPITVTFNDEGIYTIDRSMDTFIAKITGGTCIAGYTWTEQIWNGSAWENLAHGRTSADVGVFFEDNKESLYAGDIVEITPRAAKNDTIAFVGNLSRVRTGVLTVDWVEGSNLVTVKPTVSRTDSTSKGDANITCYVYSPEGRLNIYGLDLKADDQVQYMPINKTLGFLMPVYCGIRIVGCDGTVFKHIHNIKLDHGMKGIAGVTSDDITIGPDIAALDGSIVIDSKYCTVTLQSKVGILPCGSSSDPIYVSPLKLGRGLDFDSKTGTVSVKITSGTPYAKVTETDCGVDLECDTVGGTDSDSGITGYDITDDGTNLYKSPITTTVEVNFCTRKVTVTSVTGDPEIIAEGEPCD